MQWMIADVVDWLQEEDLLISASIFDEDMRFDYLSDNSKDIQGNTLFFCKGARFEKKYLLEAREKGALCYITEREDLSGEGSFILVKNIQQAIAVVAHRFYNRPSDELVLIGITGTKGKSTTAYMCKEILDKAYGRCAILSSIENYNGRRIEESHLTTQEPLQLHQKFAEMVKNGCTHCVMEVSSQALKYDRVFGLTFDIACFLNIGEDHISPIEHSSFEDYYESKKKILNCSKKVVVFNELDLDGQNIIYYGLNNNSNRALDYRIDYSASQNGETNDFYLEHIGRLSILLEGEFNIYNAAAAAIMCKELGVSSSLIQEGLSIAKVPGRMEIFLDKKNIVIVDYAHNKLSYEALFHSVSNKFASFKVITIFGCPGNKAIQRREELPKIAERYSDYIYITEEDYGEEDLQKICEEIYHHIRKKEIAEIEPSRESAIQKAMSKFDEKTVVLVLGKGRETRQKRGKEYIDVVSDVDLVKKYLRNEEV